MDVQAHSNGQEEDKRLHSSKEYHNGMGGQGLNLPILSAYFPWLIFPSFLFGKSLVYLSLYAFFFSL